MRMRLVTDRLGPNISRGSEMIFDHLKRTGESQAAFSRRIPCDSSLVTVWMRGDQRPSLELAVRMRKVLGWDVEVWLKPPSTKFQTKLTAAVAAARSAA